MITNQNKWLVLSVVLLTASAGHAKTIIVAPSGGDYTSINTALQAAVAGDIVNVRAGTYNQAVVISKNGLTLQGDPGAIIDGTGLAGGTSGISISNRTDVKVIGMTVQNFKGGDTPIGISIDGSGNRIEIRDNLVQNIESANANAHGIAAYGTASTAITNLIIDGNEIRNCKLGQSESMVLNGNVDGFVVSNNKVHDNDNIGIDFIGFEGNGPSGVDQARNGICTDNVVYNISSGNNPTYGGERSADGIYVDGGRDIVIERNRIDNCDIGIEVASEHGGKATANITARNNFVSRSYQANIMSGGYASSKGNATGIVIVNNTTYQGSDGEVLLQFNNNGVTVKNNILIAKSGTAYVSQSGSNNTNVTVDNNLYFGGSTSSAGSWSDAHAKFTNPLVVSAPSNLSIQAASPAIDAGINLGNDASGQALSGALDIDKAARVQGNAVDIGADEIGGAPPPTESACDLNNDKSTNITDVQLCVNQAINPTICTTGDIDNNGSCTVIDVQRVVNAALGGSCVTQ